MDTPLTNETALARGEEFIDTMPRWRGRGIVIVAGGVRYFTNAWVCVNMLRRWGCRLPVEFWHLGPGEMDENMKSLVQPLGVTCIDALELRKKRPARILRGWEAKPYAVLHTQFREVMLIDADNVPTRDPEYLFDTPEFVRTGAIFWPDRGRLQREHPIWELCGIAYRDEPEFESGQMVIDKQRCWSALRLTMWYNEHSDFFYRHIHGDKETFHLAWRKLGLDYAMPGRGVCDLHGNLCQHDFDSYRIFQHRGSNKWDLGGTNPSVPGFLYEPECLEYVEQLRRAWDGKIRTEPPPVSEPPPAREEEAVAQP